MGLGWMVIDKIDSLGWMLTDRIDLQPKLILKPFMGLGPRVRSLSIIVFFFIDFFKIKMNCKKKKK